ncbi:MAG: hypothetical protein Q7J03_01830 [Methanoregula sp.]|nr:hypothetical protein [Methanoregula sp.]
MKTLILALVILLCILSSGCTSDSGATTPATAVPVPVPTTEPVIVTPPPATPLAVPTTERIQTMPGDQQVNVLLSKDRPTSEIHLQYQGGPGERYTNQVLMRVYTSDTAYQEFVMSDGKKPLPGDEIVVPGTRGKDRCEVFVVSAGVRYKVLDDFAVGGGYY